MRQTFVKGTLIILIASFITRVLGFVYRILLSRIIGAEGMGLYQMAYPTMTVAVTLVTAGFPIAIAKLVAEAEARGDQARIGYIMRISFSIILGLSLFGLLLMFLGAPWLAEMLNDPRSHIVILAMIPVLPVVGISSIYRGYFQGRQNMIPSAASVIIEQLVRIALSLWIAWHLLPYGIAYATAGAMLGMVGGELCGLLILLWQYHASRSPATSTRVLPLTPAEKAATLSDLIRLSTPITASRLVGTLSYFFEPILVAQSLAVAGFAYTQATRMYGELAGMAIPLLLFPTVLTYALSVSLVPAVSELAAVHKVERIRQRVHQSMRLALVVGTPFSLLLTILAEPVCAWLYGAPETGKLLQMMAPFSLFLYYQGPLNATLQGLGQARAAMVNSFIGAALKLLAIFLLATQPALGIKGVAIAIVLSFACVTILHLLSVTRRVGRVIQGKDFLSVGLGCTVMGFFLYSLYPLTDHFSPLPQLVLLLTLSLASYLICLVMTGMIEPEDLYRLPWVGRLLSRWM